MTVSLRNILLENKTPAFSLLSKMTLVSFAALALGSLIFRKLKVRFYNYL